LLEACFFDSSLRGSEEMKILGERGDLGEDLLEAPDSRRSRSRGPGGEMHADPSLVEIRMTRLPELCGDRTGL